MRLISTIAGLTVAAALTATWPQPAAAHGAWGFEVPDASWRGGPQDAGRDRGYYPRHRVARAHHGRSAARHRPSRGGGNLVARSGASASVSGRALPHFRCLVDRLEAAGYRIDFMGGFARRSGPSAHPTGNALDVNQTARGRVTRAFPAGLETMVTGCGLYSGAHFGDLGHFEMAGKYGYVNVGRRHARYSARRWRHRSYARAR